MPGGDDPGVVVHRASLLRELLAPLSKGALHANKKLTGIKEEIDGRYEITFQDGFVSHFDAVIGADGIFSSVRDYVLQDDAEKAQGNTCRVLGLQGSSSI